MRRSLLCIALLVSTFIQLEADQWPAWRGPGANGIYRGLPLPLHWSANQNIRWQTPLPGPGNSTPIIWGQRVFITQAVEKTSQRAVICFDRRDGKILWKAGPIWTAKESTSPENPPCTPSPITDGKRVIAWFGSAGVYCFDFAGRELWHRDLGPQSHMYGYGGSPLLYHDLCIINFGPGLRSFVVALDKRTGKTVWQYDPQPIPPDAKFENYGGEAIWQKPGSMTLAEIAGSWATPLLVRTGHHDEIVIALPFKIIGLAPKYGAELWTCSGPNNGIYSAPFFGEGIVVLNSSGFRNAITAVRPGGRGDVTTTHRAWIQNLASKPSIGSGVMFKNHIYQINTSGFAECRNLATGNLVWEERLTGSGALNSSWSSALLDGDRLYLANRNADVFVLRASPKFELLATNSIGAGPMNASPAASDGDFFLRTDKALLRIGNESPGVSRESQVEDRR